MKPVLVNDWSDVDETLQVFGQLIGMPSPTGTLVYIYTGDPIEAGLPLGWRLISDNRKKCACCGQVLPKQIHVDANGNIINND